LYLRRAEKVHDVFVGPRELFAGVEGRLAPYTPVVMERRILKGEVQLDVASRVVASSRRSCSIDS
jgi:hypothetical protein